MDCCRLACTAQPGPGEGRRVLPEAHDGDRAVADPDLDTTMQTRIVEAPLRIVAGVGTANAMAKGRRMIGLAEEDSVLDALEGHIGREEGIDPEEDTGSGEGIADTAALGDSVAGPEGDIDCEVGDSLRHRHYNILDSTSWLSQRCWCSIIERGLD